jgi:hypothetical protein
MQATIEVVTGLLVGRRFDISAGAPATFGRSEEATVCLTHDGQIADLHFTVECSEAGCVLRSLAEASPTYVNGEAAAERKLEVGDKIRAGKTILAVARIHEPFAPGRPAGPGASAGASATAAASSGGSPASAEAEVEERVGLDLLDWLTLEDEDVVELAGPDDPAPELEATFTKKEKFPAALRVAAHRLTAREAVWWGILSLDDLFGDSVPEVDAPCIEAARAWVADPIEENRRAAETAALESGFEGIACWVAQGAFWSEGSIAPPGIQAVPPDERLAGQAVTAAMLLGAAHGEAKDAPKRYRAFLAKALEVGEGKHPFPDPPA